MHSFNDFIMGEWLTQLMYGRRGLRARQILKKRNWCEAFGTIIFWHPWTAALFVVCFLKIFLAMNGVHIPFSEPLEDFFEMFEIFRVYFFGLPIFYLLLILYGRLTVKEDIQAACEKIGIPPKKFTAVTPSKPAPKKAQITANTGNAGRWQCTCGRMNADYVSNCVCGVSKKEAKEVNK